MQRAKLLGKSPKDRQFPMKISTIINVYNPNRQIAGVLVALNFWHHNVLKSAQFRQNMLKKAYTKFKSSCFRLVNFV